MTDVYIETKQITLSPKDLKRMSIVFTLSIIYILYLVITEKLLVILYNKTLGL